MELSYQSSYPKIDRQAKKNSKIMFVKGRNETLDLVITRQAH
jgi:hypothetical protein